MTGVFQKTTLKWVKIYSNNYPLKCELIDSDYNWTRNDRTKLFTRVIQG